MSTFTLWYLNEEVKYWWSCRLQQSGSQMKGWWRRGGGGDLASEHMDPLRVWRRTNCCFLLSDSTSSSGASSSSSSSCHSRQSNSWLYRDGFILIVAQVFQFQLQLHCERFLLFIVLQDHNINIFDEDFWKMWRTLKKKSTDEEQWN